MRKYTFKEHLVEIKRRFLIILVFFITAFAGCYLFREDIYSFFLSPLVDILGTKGRKIIYTGLAEAFFSYIKLSVFAAFCLTIPVICYQLYAFIAPGLLKFEKRIVMLLMSFAPILWNGRMLL